MCIEETRYNTFKIFIRKAFFTPSAMARRPRRSLFRYVKHELINLKNGVGLMAILNILPTEFHELIAGKRETATSERMTKSI